MKLLVALLLLAGSVFAIDTTFGVQGRVLDGDEPLIGTVPARFRLYSNDTAGGILWEENRTVTLDSNGVFSEVLGANNSAIGLNFSETYWLEVVISGEVQSPRIRVGMALQSASTHSLMAPNVTAYGDILADGSRAIGTSNTPFASAYFSDIFLPYNLSQRLLAINATLNDTLVHLNLTLRNYTDTAVASKANASALDALNLTVQEKANATQLASYALLAGATFSGDVTVQGNLFVVKNLSHVSVVNITINGTFSPAFDNMFDVGSVGNRFRNAYFSTEIYAGGIALLDRINGNNATQEALMLTRLSAKANQSDLAANSTRLENLWLQEAADNSTQDAKFTGLHLAQPNLSAVNNFTGAQNYFANVSVSVLGATCDVKSDDKGFLYCGVDATGAAGVPTSYPATNISTGQFGRHFGNGSFVFPEELNVTGILRTSLHLYASGRNVTAELDAKANITDMANNNATIATNLSDARDRLNAQIALQAANNATQAANVSELYTRTMDSNATIATNLSSLNDRINTAVAKQAADNATIATNLSDARDRLNTQISKQATDNATIATNLTSKAPLTNCRDNEVLMNSTVCVNVTATVDLSSKANQTDLANNATRLENLWIKQVADNATIASNLSSLWTWALANNATIATNLSDARDRLNAQISKQATDNATIATNLTSLNDRINNELTLQAANNATQAAAIAARVNATGNSSISIPAGDFQTCVILPKGILINTTVCVNSTGHKIINSGVFPA